MKKLLEVILSSLVMLVAVPTAASQEVLYDGFDNAFLEFNRVEGSYDIYEVFSYDTLREMEVSTSPNVSVKREVLVRKSYLSEKAEIEEFGPLMEQEWVLSTGASTLHSDVGWQHHVSVVYVADRLLENVSVSLEYLNTRPAGGSLEIAVSEIDENGRAVWYNSRIVLEWQDWDQNIDDRTWRHVTLSAETIANLTKNRPINRIHIREMDIPDESGGGYFDDIRIHVGVEGDECDAIAVLDSLIQERGLKLDATGAVHAQPNSIRSQFGWKMTSWKRPAVILDGYLIDKLAALKYGGDGITASYIMVGEEKIIIRGEGVDLIAEDGSFNVVAHVERKRGMVCPVKLFATDHEGNESLVDETYIIVGGKCKKAKMPRWVKKWKQSVCNKRQ
jgi:hypothetical protein